MTELPTTGFILIDKPIGWTSFDAVNFIRHKIRQATGNKKIKVGHAGTLDPFASGLLIVAVGKENTKKIDDFKNLPKTYTTTLKLGATSDTFDSTGIITESKIDTNNQKPSLRQVEETLSSFVGKQLQIPPMYSAKKINGQRLYKLARQGVTVERTPNEITVYSTKLINFDYPDLTIEIECSVGTYIRTLAQDIGEKLGTGAYCQTLRRNKIGHYIVEEAIKITDLKSN